MATTGCTNVFADRETLPSHESGGGRNTMHGFRYQFLAIMVWILRALKTPLNFTVTTEENRLDKFDDFALTKYSSEGNIVSQTFVQVKHSTKDAKITLSDLFNKSDKLNLKLYFSSFMKIHTKNVPTKYILYTNRDFEYGSSVGKLNLNSSIFDIEFESELFNRKLYKFKSEFKNRDILVKKILSDSEYTEKNVEEFLSNFYFIVVGESISELENAIKNHFEESMSKNDVEKCYHKYSVNFEEWYLSKKGTVIDKASLENYFQLLKDEITNKGNFNLLAPNTNFYGRDDSLLEVENYVISTAKEQLIDVVITGTAGVGKSELVRKFASKFNERFQHIFWFNAETKETLQSSYVNLLKYFGIPVEGKNKEFDIENIVRKTNDFIRHRKCLLIFDNAESFIFSDFSQYLNSNELHRTILTSQIRDWPCSHEIHLEVFSNEDAVQFLEQNLPFNTNNRKNLHDIAKLMSYLPLALQLSVAYVTNMIKRKANIGQIYTIQNFMSDYKNCNDLFLGLSFSDTKKFDHYKKSLYLAWQLTLESICSETNGDKAVEILKIMSFLDADNISIQIFNKNFESVLEGSIYLLTSYSLIKCENGTCSIHRLLQDVIRAKIYHSATDNATEIVRKCVDNICSIVYPRDRVQNMSNHILSIWEYIKDAPKERTWFFLLDSKFRTTEFLEKLSLKSINIFKFKLIYLTESRDYKKSLHNIHSTLQKIYEVVRNCRNFELAIPLFETYLKFKDFDIMINQEWFLKLIYAFSFCYYQSEEYEKSICLFDKMEKHLEKMKRIEFLLKHRHMHVIYVCKAKALIWQHKYEEAAAVISNLFEKLAKPEFHNQEYEYQEGDYKVLSYYQNPWHSSELRCLFINLIYVLDEEVLCHNVLQLLANTFSKYSESTIDSLIMRARLCQLQGKVKEEISILEEIFDKMYHNKLIYLQQEVANENYFDSLRYSIATMLRDNATIASYKRGSLNKVCKNMKKYIDLLNKNNLVTGHNSFSFTNLQLQLANLLCKNGDFNQSIILLQSIKTKLRESLLKEKKMGNDFHFYQQSVCDIALAYYYSGDFTKAIQVIDAEIDDPSILPKFEDKIFFLVYTKCNILLMEYPQETEALNYLTKLISELSSKDTAYCYLKYKVSEILAYRGKKKLALNILNEICEFCVDDSYVKKCMVKPLQLDLLECLNLSEFFDCYENFIPMNENYVLHTYLSCFDISNKREIPKFIRTCEKLKCNVFNMISVQTKPFYGDYNYLCKNLTNVYLYLLLEDYEQCLKQLDEMKKEKLEFIFQYSLDMTKDILRIEKLVLYKRDQVLKL